MIEFAITLHPQYHQTCKSHHFQNELLTPRNRATNISTYIIPHGVENASLNPTFYMAILQIVHWIVTQEDHMGYKHNKPVDAL